MADGEVRAHGQQPRGDLDGAVPVAPVVQDAGERQQGARPVGVGGHGPARELLGLLQTAHRRQRLGALGQVGGGVVRSSVTAPSAR
ncbi:hypothetical protein KUM37_25970 [Streptomonospora sp. NEAU-YY374]|nr:hypothetical protein [Streptomonospora nanhaiensis]